MELGSFSLSLAVNDLSVSQSFYEKLGFEIFCGNAEQGWLIIKSASCIIGLFEGMLDKNTITFNPGWNADAQALDTFTDVRQIQQRIKAEGIELATQADETTTGPASFMIIDPDGNPILFDQHI